LGLGEDLMESVVPQVVAGLGGVRICTVAVGQCHTLACSNAGISYSFGSGICGQLGHGDRDDHHTPRMINALQGMHIVSVAAGADHSLALNRFGTVFSFGENRCGQLGLGNTDNQHTPHALLAMQGLRVVAVATGRYFSLVLSEASGVFSFGRGEYGQLGHGDLADWLTPQPITELQGMRLSAVACGAEHSLVVTSAGRLYTFGEGSSGALGHGDRCSQPIPRMVEGLQGIHVTSVAVGGNHSLVLSVAGVVYSVGSMLRGMLGQGDSVWFQTTPRVIEGLLHVRVRYVTAGGISNLAVTADSEVYGWGEGVGNDLDHGPQAVPGKYHGLLLSA
jgi:alpha-tubulin suppressor-like RCC1 family protein